MRNVLINGEGELICPNCGAKQQFSYRRTAAGKVTAAVTVGLVGALALPKRLQCIGCQEYLKSPPVPIVASTGAEAVVGDWQPTSGGTAFTLPTGDVQVLVTDCDWDGPARISMLKAARPGLRDHAYERMAEQIRRGEPTPVAAVTADGARELAQRLQTNGFTVAVLEPEAAEDV